MSQADQVDLDRSVGYILKRAQSALHTALEARLRTLGLGVSQYACLELLARRPDLSQSELARGAFVTRQAMNQLAAGLQSAGLITSRDDGRARRLQLTAVGKRKLRAASRAVAEVERKMLAGLDAAQQSTWHDDLARCIDSLALADRQR
jgi:DNA-binding MarR family transcriptional regulator